MKGKTMGKPTRRNRPTLIDVAERAGVSRATASLVVRNSPHVSKKTRLSVEAAIAEFGYVYNAGAAGMRAARSRTIGVIIPNLSNPFFGLLLAIVRTDRFATTALLQGVKIICGWDIRSAF